SVSSPQLTRAPALSIVKRWPPATCTGVTLPFVAPLPRSPKLPSPQHQAWPLRPTAQAWYDPTEMPVTGSGSTTRTGDADCSPATAALRLPRLSGPAIPQQYAPPSVETPQARYSPTLRRVK